MVSEALWREHDAAVKAAVTDLNLRTGLRAEALPSPRSRDEVSAAAAAIADRLKPAAQDDGPAGAAGPGAVAMPVLSIEHLTAPAGGEMELEWAGLLPVTGPGSFGPADGPEVGNAGGAASLLFDASGMTTLSVDAVPDVSAVLALREALATLLDAGLLAESMHVQTANDLEGIERLADMKGARFIIVDGLPSGVRAILFGGHGPQVQSLSPEQSARRGVGRTGHRTSVAAAAERQQDL